MASTTLARALDLPTVEIDGMQLVPKFGYFIDTHRDLPHIGFFDDDLHRGMCKPTLVHLNPNPLGMGLTPELVLAADTSRRIMVHEKHNFVTEEWFAAFIVRHMMAKGENPLDKNGQMPTSLLRDPRAKRYEMRSFRQMVRYWQERLL